VNKPLLPDYLRLEPYMRKIDTNRYYSNYGELVTTFERRLGELFGAPCVTASSATSVLTATIMALDLPKGSFIACPSWSFVATAAAIVAAGHVPYFSEVDKRSGIMWMPNKEVSAYLWVAPFGTPCQVNPEYGEIGKPVIIDAAAGFDSFSTICKPSKCPVVISTHCTKPFGTGEGGFVTCHDEPLLKKIRHILNFGIKSHTSVPYIGFNGKMSEYHAAVGLAELDGWPEKRERWILVRGWYEQAFSPPKFERWASSSYPLKLNVAAAPVIEALNQKGIMAYAPRYGIHHLKAYKDYPRTELTVTEELMEKTIMLPFYVDMSKEEVEYVVEELKKCVSQ
jgi:dTDP-4-amino-4,6-dideoxygalactose transaminase